MLNFVVATFLAILALSSSAPSGVYYGVAPTNHVAVRVDADSLEDLHDPHEILEDHLDNVEDALEDRYGVDLGDLFDVDDDGHYNLRTTYVVRPAVQTIQAVPGPTIVRKYFARPVVYASAPLRPIVHLPLVPKPLAVSPVIGTVGGGGAGVKSVGVGGAGTVAVAAVDPVVPPEVVKKIAEEEVKDAVEDIAKNPGIDVKKKAVEVVKEIAEEVAEEKKEIQEDANEAKKEASEDAVKAQREILEVAVEAQKDVVEDAVEAQKELLDDKDDDDRKPRDT